MKQKHHFSCRLFSGTAAFLSVLLLSAVGLSAAELLSDEWQKSWNDPGKENRPLQIVHGGIPGTQFESRFRFLKEECGIGGIVCNFTNTGYLESEDGWRHFQKMVQTADQLGLRIWIYDEDGYPSPAAGGVVLKGHPEFEALELVYDAQNAEEPFTVRECYEFTHATNNFCALRRYPNVLDGAAMERFLDVTHRAYAKRLKEIGLWENVEAFFTDEPSTNAVNTGIIPNLVVRTQDEPDPNKKNLPMVPWSRDFPEIYQKLYGEDLLKVRKSLFVGDSPEDKKVRVQFWQMVSRQYEENFMKKIQKWCEQEGKLSSGHALHEEALVYHVPCYGNVFSGTNTMHIAGMDYLGNRPESAVHGWRTAIYPASSNVVNGYRRMMTEISDHSERFSLKRNATLEEMLVTAGWQAAWGCTEFTLYYGVEPRGPEAHKQYCDFVGRMNAVIRDASVVKRALLYYPARDLQEEYRPIAERLSTDSQSERMKKIIDSYYSGGTFLSMNQIPFFAADERMLGQAKVLRAEGSGKPYLQLGNQSKIEIVMVPSAVQLPESVRELFKEFQEAGGTVIDENSLHLLEQIPRILQGERKHEVTFAEFEREGRKIYLLVNANREKTFVGEVKTEALISECVVLDPKTGTIEKFSVSDGKFSAAVPPLETRLFILK